VVSFDRVSDVLACLCLLDLFLEICRRREREVSASAGTSHTRCAGVVAAEVFTFRRAVARHVLTLPQESAAVSDSFRIVQVCFPISMSICLIV
jgi:hypothetical protein